MQGKRSNLEYLWSQECKQKQQSTHTTQIIKQKTRLKSNELAGRDGWGDPVDHLERATSRLLLDSVVGGMYAVNISMQWNHWKRFCIYITFLKRRICSPICQIFFRNVIFDAELIHSLIVQMSIQNKKKCVIH